MNVHAIPEQVHVADLDALDRLIAFEAQPLIERDPRTATVSSHSEHISSF